MLTLLAGAALLLANAGCPAGGLYQTARTIPKGTFQHTVSLEAAGLAGQRCGTTSQGNSIDCNFFWPTLPSYMFRYGVHNRIDIGGRLVNLVSPMIDAKFNVLRTRFFDLALDPQLQFWWVPGFTISGSDGTSGSVTFGGMWTQLPLVAGINVHRSLSIVLSPGIGYGLLFVGVRGSTSSSIAGSGSAVGDGVFGRFGIGFSIRPTAGFSIHPELTMIRSFQFDTGFVVLAGVGFQFGSQPAYE